MDTFLFVYLNTCRNNMEWGVRLTFWAALRSLSWTPSMTALSSADIHPAHRNRQVRHELQRQRRSTDAAAHAGFPTASDRESTPTFSLWSESERRFHMQVIRQVKRKSSSILTKSNGSKAFCFETKSKVENNKRKSNCKRWWMKPAAELWI